jgi:hypothetical protein
VHRSAQFSRGSARRSPRHPVQPADR